MKLIVNKSNAVRSQALLLVATVVLLLLKAFGAISIAWWACLIPSLFPLLCGIVIALVLFVGGLLTITIVLTTMLLVFIPALIIICLGGEIEDEYDEFEKKLDEKLSYGFKDEN